MSNMQEKTRVVTAAAEFEVMMVTAEAVTNVKCKSALTAMIKVSRCSCCC